MSHLTFRKLLRSLVDLLTGGFRAGPAEKLHFVHVMLVVRLAHLFGLCSQSYFHLFFAYVSALKLQQEVRPAQVAVAEEVRRKRLHYANAFNLLRPAQAHVARKLGVMVRTCEWTQRLKPLPRARARKCKNKSHSRAEESTLFGGLFSDRLL